MKLFCEPRPDGVIEIPPGHAALIRCSFGLGVRVLKREDPDEPDEAGNRIRIEVDPMPISGGYDGPALRSFMEETAVAWLQRVAPHRLAGHSDYND